MNNIFIKNKLWEKREDIDKKNGFIYSTANLHYVFFYYIPNMIQKLQLSI